MAARQVEMQARMKAKATYRLEKMKTYLGVTEGQAQQLYPVLANNFMNIANIKQSGNTNIESKEQIKKERNELKRQLKNILTPEQFKKLRAMRK